MWLALIDELAKKMPVIVIGSLKHALPDADISAGEFVGGLRNLCQKSAKIVNLVGEIPIRSIMTIISKAAFLVGLDSAPLYMAQACRVPAVSLWGPHNPAVRIGYDKDYMDLAIHNTQFCPNSPCFTYDGFPVRKCPDGTAQKVCSVLASITVDQVLAKIASLS
jgi:ADP-heptose:LPS heptosyltransferase